MKPNSTTVIEDQVKKTTLCQRAKDILFGVLEQQANQRAAYIALACQGDQELANEVQELVKIHESQFSSVLDQDLGDILALELQSSDYGQADCGSERKFTLGRELGRGGFGKVYFAQQIAPVQRDVAIKLLHTSSTAYQTPERFHAEAKAQGMMNHPNIVRILDAGKTAKDQPFLVMEYVDGQSLSEYCNNHRLKIQERLKIFIDICKGVQHAHNKAVIHRDLKPSNIIVITEDGIPVPKVIDFGVAKFVQDEDSANRLTEHGQLVGSLCYMSPEQAEANPDIDASSDIYALGVILYELLSGQLPFSITNQSGGMHAIETLKRIRDEVPLRPSICFRQASVSLAETIAAQRQTSVLALQSSLKGDLDWIIGKCLEKERHRRYDSVGSLINDLNSYLTNKPVVARPPSAVYLASKFIRRNKLVIATVSLLFVCLLLGTAGTTMGMLSASQAEEIAVRERRNAVHEREIALHERETAIQERKNAEREKELAATANARAQESNRVLGELLYRLAKEDDPSYRPIFQSALDLTIERLDSGEIENPLVVAELRQVMGFAYAMLGQHKQAEIQALQGVEVSKGVADGLRSHLSNKHALARIYLTSGKMKLARQIAEQTLIDRKKNFPEHTEDLFNSTSLLVSIDYLDRRYAEAFHRAEKALKSIEEHSKLHGFQTGELQFLCAMSAARLQRTQESKDLLQNLMQHDNKNYFGDSNVEKYLLSMVCVCLQAGDYHEAVNYATKLCDIDRQSGKPQVTHYHMLIAAQMKAGQYQAALESIEQAMKIATNKQSQFLQLLQTKCQQKISTKPTKDRTPTKNSQILKPSA